MGEGDTRGGNVGLARGQQSVDAVFLLPETPFLNSVLTLDDVNFERRTLGTSFLLDQWQETFVFQQQNPR